MSDIFTQAKRSEVMARIRSRGNRDTELALVKRFRRHGITGWRRHQQVRVESPAARVESRKGASARPSTLGPRLAVRPDFVFPKLKLAVFVDGCFWHGCPKHATWPAHRAAWWRRKIEGNRARDRKVNRALRANGWRVLRIWEHELAKKAERRLVARLGRVFG